MLTISREADYAVRLVVHLATSDKERFQSETLAQEEHVPKSFLVKILQLLIRRQLVRSFRGARGGYQLAVNPEQLTLYRVLEMVEGPMGLNLCVLRGAGCDLRTRCAVHEVWTEAQGQLRQILQSATIADLARRTLQKRLRFVQGGSGESTVPKSVSPQSRVPADGPSARKGSD